MEWVKKYLKITYHQMHCSAFVEHVLRNEFGKDYKFPQSKGSVFNQSEQIRKHLPEFCEKTDNPKNGDLVLMHGIRRMCHVGLYLKINHEDYVLHTEAKMKTAALHRLKDLYYYGLKAEGIYTWQK